ncbi:MAG: GNAT family N-acetyltransferase [Crocinitomicaceae bacterium]
MKFRLAYSTDRPAIANIYNDVSGKVRGIARRPEEITETYIFSLLNKPANQCIFLVLENEDQQIVGFVHAEKMPLAIYNHILTNYTIVIDPDMQSKGYGELIFVEFLNYLTKNRPDVKRLEMESMVVSERIEKFEQLGFKVEATIKERARGVDGKFYDQALLAWENPNFKP